MKEVKCVSNDIVLVGSFSGNPYMDTNWLAKELIVSQKEQAVNFNINVDAISHEASFTVRSEHLSVEVEKGRMVFKHSPFAPEAFDVIEKMAITLAERLPLTTCTALGVNFLFSCKPEDDDLDCRFVPKGVFNVADGINIQHSSFAYKISDTDTMNIAITKNHADKDFPLNVSFNFDSRMLSKDGLPYVTLAKNKLLDSSLAYYYKKALSVLGRSVE